MATGNQKLFALLIDADNIPAKHAADILKEITTFGEPALRRVYGDWTSPQLGDWAKTAKTLGLVAHQESANTTGKNASDIGLVIDAMDILHSGRFDGFILVSSDSDFTALANRIREQGLEVIGIGERKTPLSLRKVCNRFVFIENISGETEPVKNKGKTPANKSKKQEAASLIIAAMDNINQEDEWYRLSELGSQIMRANSDFDVRSYGHKKLSELVSALPLFETRKQDTHLLVRRTDT